MTGCRPARQPARIYLGFTWPGGAPKGPSDPISDRQRRPRRLQMNRNVHQARVFAPYAFVRFSLGFQGAAGAGGATAGPNAVRVLEADLTAARRTFCGPESTGLSIESAVAGYSGAGRPSRSKMHHPRPEIAQPSPHRRKSSRSRSVALNLHRLNAVVSRHLDHTCQAAPPPMTAAAQPVLCHHSEVCQRHVNKALTLAGPIRPVRHPVVGLAGAGPVAGKLGQVALPPSNRASDAVTGRSGAGGGGAGRG